MESLRNKALPGKFMKFSATAAYRYSTSYFTRLLTYFDFNVTFLLRNSTMKFDMSNLNIPHQNKTGIRIFLQQVVLMDDGC